MSQIEHNMSLTGGQQPRALNTIQKISTTVGLMGLGILVLALFNINFPNKSLWLTLSLLAMLLGIVGFAYGQYGEKHAGIKNDGVWFKSISSRGLWAWIFGIAMTGFYVVLYFYPQYLGLVNNGDNVGVISLFDPLSKLISGNPASQWFVYGTLYTLAILAFGIKFMWKYRHNRYEVLRTISVMFFQTSFAFFIPEIQKLENSIQQLKDDVSAKEAEVDNLYNIYISEAEGTAGTKKLGKGPVYAEKRQKHDAALADLQLLKQTTTEKIADLESQIASLQTDYDNKVTDTQPIVDNFDGLMARVTALDTLPWLPSFFIFLLFLAIETAPILAKLLAPRGEYDIKLEEAEDELKSWTTQKAQQRRALIETDHTINDRVYGAISEEEELYAYKMKLAREVMKQQQEAFYKSQTRVL